jgi:hypothetical protein
MENMKSNIALPPFHIAETTSFTVEADHELTQTLRRYQAFYKDAYGATVSEAELLREMARRFMVADTNFQASANKRRRTRRNQSLIGVEPGNGKLNFGGGTGK